MANPNPEPSRNDLEEIARKVLKNARDTALLRRVDIPIDSVNLACRIILRYFKGEINAKLEATAEHSVKDRLIYQVNLLLGKAIYSLYDDFRRDGEFARLDKKGYLLFRNLVELREIRKSSGQSARDYLSRIEEEYKNLRDYWAGVVQSFTGPSAWNDNNMRIPILRNISRHICLILKLHEKGFGFVRENKFLKTLVNEYKINIPAIIMKQLTVRPDVVAKVASIDTGVPATWLLNSFKPPVHDLRGRLARRVIVGQDHVIEKIASVISRRQEHGSSSPLASFLLLPDFTLGVQELGESLAEALFDGTDRFARFNFSKHVDLSSLNDVEYRRRHDLICRKLVQFLSRKPWCVFMIENVDKYKYAAEFLGDMLTKGKLTDAEGNSWELSNTVIIVTSSMGQDEFKAFSLKCQENDSPTSPDMVPQHKMLLENLQFISQKVDEVLVLNDVSPVDQDLITRLWTREIIYSSWESHRLILFPSEAFVNLMATSAEAARRYAMRAWLKKTINPHIYKKLDGVSADMVAICRIDVLVGTSKLSCELLKLDERLNSSWETFQSSLDPSKTAYQIEKRAAEAILELRLVQSRLRSVSDGTNEASGLLMHYLENLQNKVDCIVSDLVNSKKP